MEIYDPRDNTVKESDKPTLIMANAIYIEDLRLAPLFWYEVIALANLADGEDDSDRLTPNSISLLHIEHGDSSVEIDGYLSVERTALMNMGDEYDAVSMFINKQEAQQIIKHLTDVFKLDKEKADG